MCATYISIMHDKIRQDKSRWYRSREDSGKTMIPPVHMDSSCRVSFWRTTNLECTRYAFQISFLWSLIYSTSISEQILKKVNTDAPYEYDYNGRPHLSPVIPTMQIYPNWFANKWYNNNNIIICCTKWMCQSYRYLL